MKIAALRMMVEARRQGFWMRRRRKACPPAGGPALQVTWVAPWAVKTREREIPHCVRNDEVRAGGASSKEQPGMEGHDEACPYPIREIRLV